VPKSSLFPDLAHLKAQGCRDRLGLRKREGCKIRAEDVRGKNPCRGSHHRFFFFFFFFSLCASQRESATARHGRVQLFPPPVRVCAFSPFTPALTHSCSFLSSLSSFSFFLILSKVTCPFFLSLPTSLFTSLLSFHSPVTSVPEFVNSTVLSLHVGERSP